MPLSNPLCRTQYKAPAGEAAVEADRRLQRMQPLPQQQQHSPQQDGQQDPTAVPHVPTRLPSLRTSTFRHGGKR
jgi:hypothetical protein